MRQRAANWTRPSANAARPQRHAMAGAASSSGARLTRTCSGRGGGCTGASSKEAHQVSPKTGLYPPIGRKPAVLRGQGDIQGEAPTSERNIVVHVAVAATAGGHRPARRTADRTGGAEIAARLLAEAAASAATAIEHGEGRVEALKHDLGRVLLNAALVGPFAGLERALEVNFGALLQILLGNLAEPFVEDHDAMPLGLFLALAGRLVAPGFRSGNAQIRNRPPVLGTADLWILAEISNQNDLVDASRHC